MSNKQLKKEEFRCHIYVICKSEDFVTRIQRTALTLSLAFGLALPGVAIAEPLTIVDVLDREIVFEEPIEKVILGDGRQIYSIAPLQKDDPFNKIVAWADNFIDSSSTLWGDYSAKFPAAMDIALIGDITDGDVSPEHLIGFDADVFILPLDSERQAEDANIVETLSQIGIEVVFIDVQEYPRENTDRSLRILGQIFDAEEEAEAFITWREKQFARVTDVIAANEVVRPVVFVDRFGGLPEACCNTYGPNSFGELIDMAGGTNLAAAFVSTTEGALNPEQILASKPEVYFSTGSDLDRPRPTVRVYAGADPEVAQAALKALVERPAFVGSPAVESGRVHAIWHPFDTNPYDVVAFQVLAKWIQPALFADLDPDATFKELHDLFLPVEYKPGYWVSLEPSAP
jgi:iron complex transport system substrate-binding protein